MPTEDHLLQSLLTNKQNLGHVMTIKFLGNLMASHPYISGPGNIVQMITFLKKNFPSTVNAETVKKLGLASNNESYVINALQFIGLINEEGKRTENGHQVLTTHDELSFNNGFSELIRHAYKDLFELRGEDAWRMSKDELIGYFRSTDKTSEVIGGRQAGVFQAFRTIAGHGQVAAAPSKPNGSPKPVERPARTKPARIKQQAVHDGVIHVKVPEKTQTHHDMALTVRIEINLPADGSQDTYDNIFKSIKANLLP